jgi:hypothetical protein
MTMPIVIDLPHDQIEYSRRLLSAQVEMLQKALLAVVGKSDIVKLDSEIAEFVPSDCMRMLASRGLRAELAFALPSVLMASPRLLSYYRLLLGFSDKEFYNTTGRNLKGHGLKPMENNGAIPERKIHLMPALCMALNASLAHLVRNLPLEGLEASHLGDLTIMTFGPACRGGHSVRKGQRATAAVRAAITGLVSEHVVERKARGISLRDATGRDIAIRFGADPDISVMTRSTSASRNDEPLLAIEVKGGADKSNIWNRLGEAEKSHLVAKAKGFNEFWTIYNIDDLPIDSAKQKSPTTTAFWQLKEITSGSGCVFEDFAEAFLRRLRLPVAARSR